jgi:hypothetical protein
MIDLPTLRSLLEAATPGPWRTELEEPGIGDGGYNIRASDGAGLFFAFKDACGDDIENPDAHLIVAAINALPQLLSVYEAALALTEQVERGGDVGGMSRALAGVRAAVDLARSKP